MATLTILTDSNIKGLLGSLTRDNVVGLASSLQAALTKYSTLNEQAYQPHRAVVSRENEQVTLFMPSTSPSSVATKIVGCPPPSSGPEKTLRSVLTLCDAEGRAYGVLNAAALTAFRTSLGSMLLYPYRKNTRNVVVFGAGNQALWHIRLALLLRGREIEKITIVNRSNERSSRLLETLQTDDQAKWDSKVKFEIFDPAAADKDKHLEGLLKESDVVFCTTPAKSPLFPAHYLLSEEARKKERCITAIGSYTLDMQELDPELLKGIVNSDKSYRTKAGACGSIFVDTRQGCFQEAGEVVKAGLSVESMIEVGELPGLEKTPSLTAWLQDGIVVYKSVGTGVMDLAIGEALVALSKEKGVGVNVADF